MTFHYAGTVGGITFGPQDIMAFDQRTGSWSLFFDGSDVGLSVETLNDIEILPDSSILFVLDSPGDVPGLGWVDNKDVLRFVPASLGSATDGDFEWYIDGSDVGLTDKTSSLDVVAIAPDGRLLVSPKANTTIGSLTVAPADIIAFNAEQFGQDTRGTWEMYFDGSDVGLSDRGEDVDAVWVDPTTGDIYLSTTGGWAVDGLSGHESDVFVCEPLSLGDTTSCNFSNSLYWDATVQGLAGIPLSGIFVWPNQPIHSTPTPCPNGPVRIMPLGDSITRGVGSTYLEGYRRRLDLALNYDGYQVDFVGGLQDGRDDFDRDHEGHGGWHTEGGTDGGLVPNVYDWLQANPADLILLHIGTNDISNGDQDIAELDRLLDEIDRYSTDIPVVLARLINRKTYSLETAEYNQQISDLAMQRIASGDLLYLVDMEPALIYPDDMSDNVHPNDVGYYKMAAVWKNELEAILPVCR